MPAASCSGAGAAPSGTRAGPVHVRRATAAGVGGVTGGAEEGGARAPARTRAAATGVGGAVAGTGKQRRAARCWRGSTATRLGAGGGAA